MVFSITCLLSWLVLPVVTMMNECRTNLQACNLEICSGSNATLAPGVQRWTRSDYASERSFPRHLLGGFLIPPPYDVMMGP